MFISHLVFMILCFKLVFTTYDLRDGQLPLERFQVAQIIGGNVKNSEAKTDHHIPDKLIFPPVNYYHYRFK
ncbi:uncharacterized protein CELE_C16D2.3 [Caenorhabditis elegans]|uniref:Secreted protein n=1 Tax=Caenorhabditis elegans TaxID=6239 RepID=D6VPA5_CAEEL|nr:Secreted protein [Caenorhabditis elegans]CBM41192.1 Secreted protein [Caenorhabditis elegans]|eukprot:NP_001254202.1 Uncharacterized protein CELE_C16D2.3 [Caenorhabditis elegans]